MATRQRDIFTTIHTEGAILPPDLLQRIAEGGDGLDGLRAEDYHRPGEKLNEVINRAWNVLLGAWANFQTARAQLPADDIGTTLTRERWLLPLFRELDFGRLPTERAVEIDGKSYPISHRDAEGNVPIHLVSYKVDLDRRTPGVAGAATTSPHSMVQVFLNRSDDVLWGFLSNGLRLRILRDNVSLTRQAYVEFDLEAMMTGEVYADFVLLWLLCHSSRVEGERPEQFWLEQWMQTAVEQGTRALDQLRDNVQVAIERLGAGFLAHPHNMDLRDKLQDGRLDQQDYYRQLLRLVYRLLFLFVAEDRGLLLDPAAGDIARARYIEYYSTRRLRDLAERLRGTRHHDLYHGLRLVMRLLGAERNGEGRALGLPVLGSYLFSDAAVIDIINCEIGNRDLLDAIRALAFTEDLAVRRLRPIDYQHLGPEELGSVYESLLELHPEIYINASRVTDRFKLTTASGHERKTTGSYYTPSSLIQALLDSALDPVLAEARARGEAAILDLKICDPACGSGHFLIAASHRLAKALAAVRTQEDEPAPAAVRSALRDVIGHCVYGVDINPMAVELCKVGLWMEALEPGKPLSFLDHRIQCGNSLLGTTPALMANGIPEDTFPTKSGLIEGDENTIVSKLRSRNRDERKARETGQRSMFEIIEPPADYGVLAAEVDALDAIEDATLAGVRAKEARYRALGEDPDYIAARFLADAWCAAFVWHKAEAATFGNDDRPVPQPITDLTYRLMEEKPHDERWRDMRPYVAHLREHYQFFHWHVAFPDVFNVPQNSTDAENMQTGWSGGFDVVLGNPPWESADLMKVEFFAVMLPNVVAARTTQEREQIINKAIANDPSLGKLWYEAQRKSAGESHFLRVSGTFPLTSAGKQNTYRSFGELSTTIVAPWGRVGVVLKSGIINAQDNQEYFASLVRFSRIASVVDFINTRQIFPSIVANERFCLFVATGLRGITGEATFLFGVEAVEEIKQGNELRISSTELATLNPNDFSVPPITSERDKRILLLIHERFPVLYNETLGRSPFAVRYSRGHLNSSTDSNLFSKNTYETLKDRGFIDTDERLTAGYFRPLVEGKLIGTFNHRFGTFQGVSSATRFGKKAQARTPTQKDMADPSFTAMPRFWLEEEDAVSLLEKKEWGNNWIFAYRHVCRAIVDARTTQASIIPANPTSDSCALLFFDLAPEQASVAAILTLASWSSFVGDYVVRQKIYGPALTKAISLQLPVPTDDDVGSCALDFIVPRVLELTYTAWDLQPFAQDVGWDGPPFVWDEERRFLMRCELDALYFHLYGIARDDVDYIMETFPIVKRKDIAATATDDFEGEYVTKRVILGMYDQMAALGVHDDTDRIADFETWLTPPPADPSVAHPERG